MHLELGKVYISLRRTDEAIRELEMALKDSPAMAMRAISWVACWSQEGRFADGIPYLERAKKVKPDFWAPYFYLGRPNSGWSNPRKPWCCCSGPWR